MITDNLGISLYLTTAIFSVALTITFLVWHNSEHTLSIPDITTIRRENFTGPRSFLLFSLGTAAGNLISGKMSLGYIVAGLIFGGGIALIALAYYAFKLNGVLAFWLAYILTRPLGASIGDLLTQTHKDGGLGFGTYPVNTAFLVVIVGLVIFLSMHREIDGAPAATTAS